MIFLFHFLFQLNDDLMKRLNAMDKNMVRVCFSVCSYTCIHHGRRNEGCVACDHTPLSTKKKGCESENGKPTFF